MRIRICAGAFPAAFRYHNATDYGTAGAPTMRRRKLFHNNNTGPLARAGARPLDLRSSVIVRVDAGYASKGSMRDWKRG